MANDLPDNQEKLDEDSFLGFESLKDIKANSL